MAAKQPHIKSKRYPSKMRPLNIVPDAEARKYTVIPSGLNDNSRIKYAFLHRRALIFCVVVVFCIVTVWQGINASSLTSRFDSPFNLAGLRIEAAVQGSTLEEMGKTKTVSASYGSNSVLQSDTQPNSPLDYQLMSLRPRPERTFSEDDVRVIVAVLDSGIDAEHEGLRNKVVAEINFTDTAATTDDIYGHGTPVAGIIAANDVDGFGITGLAPLSYLFNVKVADDRGRSRQSILADGIIWAVDNGAQIINISIELKESTADLKEAVDYAWSCGAIIVAAAGNDGSSFPVYPSSYENCIAVTAVQESGNLLPLANYGDWVDVAAPGFNIYSTLPDNNYGYKNGTSFAAAYVSGLAALLFPVAIDINGDGKVNDEVQDAIYSGCRSIDIEGTGKGLIDVTGSLAELAVNAQYSP